MFPAFTSKGCWLCPAAGQTCSTLRLGWAAARVDTCCRGPARLGPGRVRWFQNLFIGCIYRCSNQLGGCLSGNSFCESVIDDFSDLSDLKETSAWRVNYRLLPARPRRRRYQAAARPHRSRTHIICHGTNTICASGIPNSLDIALTSRLARHSMPRWWTPWGLDKSFHLGDDFQTQEHVCRTYRSQLDTELHCAQLRTVLCTALRTALHCRAARRGGGLWEDHQVDLKDPYIERMDPTHPTGRGRGI